MLPDRFDAMVEELAVPHRRRAAEKNLMAAGSAATPAVRRGLQHANARVRSSCCRVLDHFLDEAAIPELIANLRHEDDSVRAWALHALACDRCKEGSCRPGEDTSLPLALRMLETDASATVRNQALRLAAEAVHRDERVLPVIERVRRNDPDPMIRKVAAWWVPGGPRYERTKPKVPRPKSTRSTPQDCSLKG